MRGIFLIGLISLTAGYAVAGDCNSLLTPPPIIAQQTDYTCGPATVRSLLLLHGIDSSEFNLACQMKTTPEDGTSGKSMVRALRSFGFRAKMQTQIRIEDLKKLTDQKGMAILNVQSGGEGHWVLLYGFDDRGRALIMDPWKAVDHKAWPPGLLIKRWYGNEGERAGILIQPTT